MSDQPADLPLPENASLADALQASLSDVHPSAVALTAMRPMSSGVGRYYSATTFPQNPWQGCEHMIRMARACGFVTTCPGPCEHYAVLDVLNFDGDIIQDFCITTARAFRWFYRKLHLRVDIGEAT